jgi:two-component system chemotaxis response regulator CheY
MTLDTQLAILVVDDYASMRRIMRSLLTRIGFDEVDQAADVHEALAMMHRRAYGLVISDWNMEPLSGLDFLKMVRSDRSIAATPLMLVTANEKAEYSAQALAAGATDYLVKPFGEQVLRDRIRAIFRTVRAA